MMRSLLVMLLALVVASPALAQSQAINANIEGVIKDSSGAVLPGVTVTATNVETGNERSVVTDNTGTYRAALLPLGTYRIKAELSGFKIVQRTGISLSAGQTAIVDVEMQVGAVQETVNVTATPPITEPAKIDLGRTIGTNEFKNLPMIARNSFNFGLLQPNVTGYENVEFGATNVNANGSQMRTNYQIDGSSATQKNRAGLRMFQPSEIMVQEVKVTSSGFAPEFGQTTGMVYNVITPSGTNRFSGDGSFRFRRKDFSARPLTLAATAPTPDTHVDDFAGTIGGPIIRDRLHFFTGYEYLKHDLSADRVIVVTPATAQLLGLSSSALGTGVFPARQTVNMFIGKSDYQIDRNNHLSGRYSQFNNKTPENVGTTLNGVPLTREAAFDFQDRMDSAQVQLGSTLGANMLNEVRVAYGRRNNPLTASAAAGPGPVVQVSGVAVFGGVRYAPNTPGFVEDYWQVVNNFSWFKGRHDLKAGIDMQFIHDTRVADTTALYTFPDVASYLAAKAGTNRVGYTNFQQSVGDASLVYRQQYYSAFAQDDLRLTEAIRLLFGVRYDLFKVPDGDPSAPHPASRDFRVDKNNVAPRVGVAWSLDRDARTVVRASTGIMYEPPLGAFYENALLQDGNPKLLSVNISPGQTGAPAFPATLSSLPPGVTPSKSILIVDPNFSTQYAYLSNVQVERGLTSDISVSAGYVNSTGRNLPLFASVNMIPTGATLPDSRPIYSSTISAATRVDPNFNVIRDVRSTGTSQYNAMTLSFNKRMSHGYEMHAFYTLSKAEDNGVMGGDYVVGSTDRSGISDPSNEKRDYGYTSWNQTHTFVLTAILAPRVSGDGVVPALANNNQVGLVFQANSGLPYNIRSTLDLNQDGIADADRPNGIARNSGTLGRFATVDLRYSRFVTTAGRQRIEAFAELKNAFNRKNIRAVNSAVTTDELGNPLAPIPTAFPVTQVYEARQFQLGFKYHF